MHPKNEVKVHVQNYGILKKPVTIHGSLSVNNINKLYYTTILFLLIVTQKLVQVLRLNFLLAKMK